MSNIAYMEHHPSFWKSLMQWLNQPFDLKTLIHHQTKPTYLSSRTSKNGKAKLYFVSRGHSTTLAVYELVHEDGKGKILFVFSHLGKLRNKLDKAILKTLESGHLSEAESLCKQRKNMQLHKYTHRLQVFRVRKEKHLSWVIDLDFHKSDSYGSGTGCKVLQEFLINLLDNSCHSSKYGSHVENILHQDFAPMIKQSAEVFYPCFDQKRINCMVSPLENSSHHH